MKRRDFMKLGAGFGAAGLGAAGLAVGLPFEANAQTKAVFKASDVQPPGYPTVAATENLGKKLSGATQGRLSIQMYPSMQLGGEKETIEQTQIGAIQLSRVSVGTMGPIVDDINVINMPFLFKSTTHADKMMDGPIGQELLDKISASPNANLVALCWMNSGARSLYNTKHPIKSIEDVKGLKFRVIGNPIFIDMMNALGGNGVAMGYDQVFSALQTGVIDGAENNMPSYVFSNHYTAAKYFSRTEHLDDSRGTGVLQADLEHAVGRRPGTHQEVRPRSSARGARAVESIRTKGAGEGHGRRLPDRRDRRQDAVPERGQTGLGQIRPEISGHDQAHSGDCVIARRFHPSLPATNGVCARGCWRSNPVVVSPGISIASPLAMTFPKTRH